MRRAPILLLLTLSFACGSSSEGYTLASPTEVQAPSPPEPAPPVTFEGLARLRFNQLAMRLGIPVFWLRDADEDGALDPDEVHALLFYGTDADWVADGAFTPAFVEAWHRIEALDRAEAPEDARLALVRQELDHAAPTLVYTDVTSLAPPHRAFTEHMMRVAELIDALYAKQVGMTAMAGRLGDDPESRSLFRRNWGAGCRGSTTESEEGCSAIDGAPKQPVDVYPSSLQDDEEFCATLEARPDSETLLTPFTVVREREGELAAVPYTEAYGPEMRAIADELSAAAEAMTDQAEQPLVTYLRAAADSFRSNDWVPADEAWSRMNARNSTWYVRVGPDETYWDPCSRKAGFHLTLARINRDSLAWQDRLTPIQADMEQSVASLARRYRARDVAFHMPDFIDIVVNAGDDRDAFGATIGQSLPNWGPVAEEGRGRTVAMSNLYTDPDSQAMRRAQAASLLSSETMETYTSSPEPGLISTILHEATHNLGPGNEYRYRGKTADDAFGGGLASMLEELKAQTGALYFIDVLRERGIIDEETAKQTYLDSIVWAFGHISRGMVTPSGQRKAYSQLAAIQVGFLMDEGAIRFDPNATAADGTHQGAFTVDFSKMAEASRKLMERVMNIKATNDRRAAEQLADQYVEGETVPQPLIVERYRDFPQTSFVYAVEL